MPDWKRSSARSCWALLGAALLTAGCVAGPAGSARTPEQDAAAELMEQLPVDQIIAEGDAAARQGDYRRALFLYMQAVDAEPTAPHWLRVGLANVKLGNQSLAWSAYSQAIEADADYAPAHEEIGLLYLAMKQPAPGRHHLERATEIDPQRWRSHNALGVLFDADLDHQRAIGHYEQALASNPDSAEILNNLAYSHFLAGRFDEARAFLQRALLIDPKYESAIANLGLLHARQGHYREAVATLERIMEAPAAHNDVGYLALRQGDLDMAEWLLMEAIRLAPRYYQTANENLERVRWARDEAARDGTAERSADQPPADAGTRPLRRRVVGDSVPVLERDAGDAAVLDYLEQGDEVEVIQMSEGFAYVVYTAPTGEDRLSGWVSQAELAALAR